MLCFPPKNSVFASVISVVSAVIDVKTADRIRGKFIKIYSIMCLKRFLQFRINVHTRQIHQWKRVCKRTMAGFGDILRVEA